MSNATGKWPSNDARSLARADHYQAIADARENAEREARSRDEQRVYSWPIFKLFDRFFWVGVGLGLLGLAVIAALYGVCYLVIQATAE